MGRRLHLRGEPRGRPVRRRYIPSDGGADQRWGIRNDSLIPASSGDLPYEVTQADINSIAPFANIVGVFEAKDTATLKRILEHAYSGLPTAEGRFGQIAGMTVTVDASQTAQAVEDGEVTVDGAGVPPGGARRRHRAGRRRRYRQHATTVNFATIDFLAAGGRLPVPDGGLHHHRCPLRPGAARLHCRAGRPERADPHRRVSARGSGRIVISGS